MFAVIRSVARSSLDCPAKMITSLVAEIRLIFGLLGD